MSRQQIQPIRLCEAIANRHGRLAVKRSHPTSSQAGQYRGAQKRLSGFDPSNS